MALYIKKGALSTLVILTILPFSPSYLIALQLSALSSTERAGFARPVSMTTPESEYGVTVDILGDVKVLLYRTAAFDSPPMVVVDNLRRVPFFQSAASLPKSNNLRDIRYGYHTEKIKAVSVIRESRINATEILGVYVQTQEIK